MGDGLEVRPSLKDLGQNAVVEGMNSLMLAGVVGELLETKYTDAFRPLFQRLDTFDGIQ